MNNKNYEYDVMKFMTPCFENVSGEPAQVTLADITVSGYKKADGSYLDQIGQWGVSAPVTLAKINANGAVEELYVEDEGDTVAVEYIWNDTPFQPAGWYDYSGNAMKDGASYWGDAEDIIFKNGNGFRLLVVSDYNEDKSPVPFTINFNGAVIKGDIGITSYTPGVMLPAGNPTPVPVKLSDMFVTGYTDEKGAYLPSIGQWGVSAAVTLAKINANGALDEVYVEDEGDTVGVEYFWNDTPFQPAGWYDYSGNPMKGGASYWGDADQIEYKACDGFRILLSEDYEDGEGKTLQFVLNFPSVLD